MKRATGKLLALFAVLILAVSCKDKRNTFESSVESILNKGVSLAMFETVNQRDSSHTMNEFCNNYSTISIVFLQDGCAPCYPKFIEWHKRMEQMVVADDYTVLFVINARHYENFVRNARIYGDVDERYYYVMDPSNRFLMGNSSIPRTIIDRSLLIDKDNHIKLVGEPFANADMTKVFHIVTGVDTQHSGESK